MHPSCKMSGRLPISRRRLCPLPSTVTSMQPASTCSGKPTILTPVHTGGMRGSWSQTRELMVSVCPHLVGAGAANALGGQTDTITNGIRGRGMVGACGPSGQYCAVIIRFVQTVLHHG